MSIATEIEALQTNLASAKNAVETKGGTVGDTGLAGLAAEIASIPSGGSVSDDVRFIDYDGTVVAQMSIAEAQALTSLPVGPTHTGLTFDGWTHTLQEVKTTTRKLDIGAMYVSADNPDQTIFGVRAQKGVALTIRFTQDTANGVDVDWGDGSAVETFADVGSIITASHTYTTTPINMTYIRLTPQSGVSLVLEDISNNTPPLPALFILVGKASYTDNKALAYNYLSELIISKKYTSTTLVALKASFLKALVVPNTIDTIAPACFGGAYGIKEVVIPNSVTTIGATAFGSTSSLRRLILPNSLTTLGGGIFSAGSNSFPAIEEIYIPSGVTSLDYAQYGMFQSAASLRKIEFDNNIQSLTIGNAFVRNTKSIESITIPAFVTSIGAAICNASSLQKVIFKDRATLPLFTTPNNTFITAPRTYVLDFTDFTQVPSMNGDFIAGGINNGVHFTILVPSSLLSSWAAHSDWATYADYIIGV